jgi:hypothetical protein
VTGDLVRIPGFSSRSARGWIVATVLAVLAVGGYVGVSQPENRIYVVTVLPALAVFLGALVWQSTWLDPDGGALMRVRCRTWRREVRLASGTTVSLVPNGGGTLLLRAAPAQGRGVDVQLVARTDYLDASQPPALLRRIADAVEAHRAGGAGPVAAALRSQADHLDAGGTVAGSPLAGLITTGVLGAAKAGGAGAVGGHLG